MSTWGFFTHAKHPFPPHPHPVMGRVVHGVNELLVAGAAGLGMFSEAYFLFAIGNIHTIFEVLYPTCFGQSSTNPASQCSTGLVAATTYIEVTGLIIGMIIFGFLAQILGRRWSSRTTATLMLIGGILLVAANGPDLTSLFIMFDVGLFIFGVATGGEYPTAATSAAEGAELGERPHYQQRGKLMVLTFAMQGWGNFVNTCIIAFLLAVTGNGSCPAADHSSTNTNTSALCNTQGLDITWRVQYAVGLMVVIGMGIYRFFFLEESAVWQARRQKLREIRRSRSRLEKEVRAERWGFLAMKQYNSRLFGVSICWYLSDVAFYGTKLFQGTLATAVLGRDNTLMNIITGTLIYSAVSLVGYYLAALTMDCMGRLWMQAAGFLIVGVIYLICGFAYGPLTQGDGRIAFAFLFYLSSLFIQWGPNATTFLLPGELFPTPFRSLAHGIAASSGKFGALTASLVFSLANNGHAVSAQTIFIAGGFCCIAGWVITLIFVPDTTNLGLREVDKRWDTQLEGEEYKGAAECWENLSYFECWLLGVTRRDSVKFLPPDNTEEAKEGSTGGHHPSKERSSGNLDAAQLPRKSKSDPSLGEQAEGDKRPPSKSHSSPSLAATDAVSTT